MKIEWDVQKDYLVGIPLNSDTYLTDLKDAKIAAFDMDDTLIKTKSGKDFAEDENDWEIFDKCIPQKLAKLVDDGFMLVIISNQLGISKGKVHIDTLKSKLELLVNYLNLNFIILCAFEDNNYRKPRMGMWGLIDGDKTTSFYCGDAGGLAARKVSNVNLDKDFSDTDLKFARNLNIKFIHRDEFVYDVKYTDATYKINYPVDFKKIDTKCNYTFIPKPKQEMILNVGLPASGKSYFAQTYVVPHNYEYINQDTLKTAKKCVAAVEKALKLGKSVIVDNTNLTSDSRKVFIDIATKNKVPSRCLLFNTPLEVCKHNSYFRNYTTNGAVKVIPKMVYNMMKKKYVKPELTEGFSEINEINFSINLDDKMKELYQKYYE